MIKNLASLEIKKGERLYRMLVENDSPLGEVFDVLSEMRSFVFERVKAVEEESKKKEEVKVDEEQKIEV